jgi:hypothetical protein
MVLGQLHPFHPFARASVGTGTFYPLGISVGAAVFAATIIDSLAWKSYTGLESGFSGSGDESYVRCTGTGQSGCKTSLSGGAQFYRTVSHASDDKNFPYVNANDKPDDVGVRYRLPYYPFFNLSGQTGTGAGSRDRISIDFGRAIMLSGLVYPYISIKLQTGASGISSVGSGSGTASISIMNWGTVQMYYSSKNGSGNIVSTGDIWKEKDYYSLEPSSSSASTNGNITITSKSGINLTGIENAYFGSTALSISSKTTGSITLNGFTLGKEPIRIYDKRITGSFTGFNRYVIPYPIEVRS